MGEIQTVNGIEEKKEAEEQYLEMEENHEALKEIRGQIMKHYGKCKECKRTEKTYKDLCFWCWVEKYNNLIYEIQKTIREAGRSSLIDKRELEKLRDEFMI